MTTNNKTFQEFTKMIQVALQEIYQEHEVNLTEVRKDNGIVLTGVMVRHTKETFAPTVYLNDSFPAYQAGLSIQEIVKSICAKYEASLPHVQSLKAQISTKRILDFASIKDQICYKLVNREKNQELLQDRPFLPFEDLAITFYVLVTTGQEKTEIIAVKNTFMEAWGVDSPQALWELAKENTQRLFPGKIASIQEMIAKLLDEPVILSLNMWGAFPMYVCTNEANVNGAGTILYDGLLSSFSKTIGGNCYIIPSSIHETILVPELTGMTGEEIACMVREVNSSDVSPEEVLSDHVYYYDKQLDRIQLDASERALMIAKQYYDPEYNRTVTEEVIRKQYEVFQKQSWFHKTYEEFRDENFDELSDNNIPWYNPVEDMER